MKAVHSVLEGNTHLQNMEHDRIIAHEIEYLKHERIVVFRHHDHIESELLTDLKLLDDTEHQTNLHLEYEDLNWQPEPVPVRYHHETPIPLPPILVRSDDYGEHFADRSEVDLNLLTEHNVNFLLKCDELFHSDFGAPIPFNVETKGKKSVIEND